MKKDAQQITAEIMNLVSELAALAGAQTSAIPKNQKKTPSPGNKSTSGATGGIRVLIEEGKLDSPEGLTEIREFLRQEGRHYPRQNVSMALLNLVRDRVLTRLREKGGKGWKYVVRR